MRNLVPYNVNIFTNLLNTLLYLKYFQRGILGRWRRRRMLGSLHPVGHLDSTHTCLNNQENRQKTSRMDSLEPSVDERSTEEGRKGGEVVCATRTGGRELGRVEGRPTGQAEPPSLACKSRRAGQSVFWQQAGLNIWKVIS